MEEFPDIEPFDLLAEIEKDLGEDAAMRLCAIYGGQMVTIPVKAIGSRVENALGPELALWLAEEFGGITIQVPNGLKYRMAHSRRTVADNSQMPANQLAVKLGITYRRVLQIRQKIREEQQAQKQVLPRARAAKRT